MAQIMKLKLEMGWKRNVGRIGRFIKYFHKSDLMVMYSSKEGSRAD